MITGHYSRVLPELKKKIGKILKKGNFLTVYVGATHSTDERFKKYLNWEHKEPIYKTTSKKFANIVEKELINYCKVKFPSCNIADDSKGLKDGKAEYFVYVLADTECRLRK